MILRIATRASALALAQARLVADRIRAHHPEVTIEEVLVSTKGDRVQDRPLAHIGGKGLFVSEVEAALARGDADIAVHSLKDVPGDTPLGENMMLAAFPERGLAKDVLLTADGQDLMSLPRGARIGTTSLRRSVQLGHARPDLVFRTLRGNIQTRIQRLQNGDFDAIVLAAAGLKRSQLLNSLPHWLIPTDVCLPAVGQGTLAIEVHQEHLDTLALVECLDHQPTRIVTTAERAMLKTLFGNCHSPIAGHAHLSVESDTLRLEGMVAAHDGFEKLEASSDLRLPRDHKARLQEAEALGVSVATQLLSSGAKRLIDRAAVAAASQQLHDN